MPLNHPSIEKILGYSIRDFKDKYRLALIIKNKGKTLKDILHFKHIACSLNDKQKLYIWNCIRHVIFTSSWNCTHKIKLRKHS